MKFYISQSGKPTVIAEMNDAHLLNAYKHYSVRYFEIRKIKTPDVIRYARSIKEIIDSLKEEVERRNLPTTFVDSEVDNGVDMD